MSVHQFLNPEDMMPPVGFSHVAVAAPGRLVFLAGQTAHQADGSVAGTSMAEQFAAAAANVGAALSAAGATPADVVSMQIFTSDVEAYRSESKAIGAAYREVFGPHYPPMALFGVTRLYDPAA
ncbi:MAG TPA: RidA family protein, partial [Acidimicrobiia bacterium]|nr:RidA family protein [Acidimicrobiia bacterium]